MNTTKFQLELNLQKISMVSIATMLWDTVEMKKQLKTHYLEMSKQKGEERRKCLSLITETLLHYLNSELPSCLLAELKETITLIGGKIYNWILYVTIELGLDFIFCEKIYWTSYGIDEAKIFNCYWKELVSTNDFRNDLHYSVHAPTAFSLACIYRCDKFINDHVNEMTEELVNFYPLTSLTTDEIYNITTLYICSHLNKNFDKNISRPVEMFKLCVRAGFSKAAKFYWTKLNETDKNSDLFRFVVELCYDKEQDRKFFIQEKHCEILYFLISELGEEEIRSVFEVDGDKVIQTFLSAWPYQKLIVNMFEYDWNFKRYRLIGLFHIILWWKIEFRESNCHLLDELYFQISKMYWDKLSEKEKDTFVCRYVKSHLIVDIVLSSDFRTLNLILKDAIIEGKNVGLAFRKEVIEASVLLLRKVKTISAVDESIEKMFNSNPVLAKDPLKGDFKRIATFLAKQNGLDITNQFMNWLSDSDEENFRFKSEIDASSVCFELVKVCFYDSELNSIAIWRFETEADVRNFKENMKSINFISVRGENYLPSKYWDMSDLELEDYVSWLWAGDFRNKNSESITSVRAYSTFKIASQLCH